MTLFTHIIVKWHADRWQAWFENEPSIVSDEPTAVEAIYELMQIHSLPDLRLVQCVSVDDGTIIGRTQIRATDNDSPNYPFPTSAN